MDFPGLYWVAFHIQNIQVKKKPFYLSHTKILQYSEYSHHYENTLVVVKFIQLCNDYRQNEDKYIMMVRYYFVREIILKYRLYVKYIVHIPKLCVKMYSWADQSWSECDTQFTKNGNYLAYTLRSST